MIFGQAPGPSQLAAHHLPRALLRGLSAGALPDADHRGRIGVDEALDALNQVVLEPGTPEFPVGIYLCTHVTLPLQGLHNGLVLDGGEFNQSRLTALVGAPGLLDLCWPQQASHVVGAVDSRHLNFLLWWQWSCSSGRENPTPTVQCTKLS